MVEDPAGGRRGAQRPGGSSLATILFTDVVGSTAFRERYGESAAEELRREHDRLVEGAVQGKNGIVVKGLGDGAMASFEAVSDAVEAAVGIQQGVERVNRTQAHPAPLELRVGLSVGEVVWEEGDCFGTAVIEASRLCGAATGRQIIASDLVRVLAGGRVGSLFTSIGELDLKGLSRPLEAVEVAWSTSSDDTGVPLPAALERSGRLPLVGRDDEVAAILRIWKDVVANGHSAAHRGDRAVMVSGEPGVGKTRLVREVASLVHQTSGLVLFGQADAELKVAYKPFTEALEGFASGYPLEELRNLMGPLSGELTWLIPSLSGRVPGLGEPMRVGPETGRYRLFEAVVDLFAATSQVAPVLLILDDVHWADSATLLLLRHLLRSNEPMRLLVLCTYRDTDVDRDHQLRHLLADLRRAGRERRLPLAGLGPEGVAEMVAAAAEHELEPAEHRFAAELHAETGGNAFFIEEVLLSFVESGELARTGGRWIADSAPGASSIPEGVREVVEQRLMRLPAGSTDVLAVAAVIGVQFDLPLLAGLVDGGMPTVIETMEAAETARVTEPMTGRPGRYRFTHMLVRSVVYEGLATSRRRWLHRAVGLALEERGDSDDRLAELAMHFWESAAVGEAERAVMYARRAGDQARRVLAFERAATQYERALVALELVPDQDPVLACDLRLARAEALNRAGDERFRDNGFAAADTARTLGDHHRLAEAALLFSRFGPAGPVIDDAELSLIEEALDRLDPGDSSERARLLAGLGAALARMGPRAKQLSREAVAMARRLDDPEVLARVLPNHHAAIAGPDAGNEWPALAAELVRLGERLQDPEATLMGYLCSYASEVERADLAAADAAADAADRLARTLRQPTFGLHVLRIRTAQALLAGRVHEAEQLSAVMLTRGREGSIPSPMVEAMHAGQQHLICEHRGNLEPLVPGLTELLGERPDWPFLHVVLARLWCTIGRPYLARPVLEQAKASGFTTLARDDFWFEGMIHLTAVAATLDDGVAAAGLYERLRPYSGRNTFTGMGSFGPVDRPLGVLATIGGDFDTAELYFRSAIDTCRRMRADGWATHARMDWAEMLHRRGDRGDDQACARLAERIAADGDRLDMPGVVARAKTLTSP